MALNVTTAVFGENCNTATASPSLAQWDTEQVLQISGIDLPDSYKVEFSTVYTRNAIPEIGDASGVAIPNVLLQRSAPITAYVVLYGENGGRNREYWITIYITPGQPPETTDPDPEQEDIIDQAIAALNNGVAAAEAAAEAIQDMDVEAETLAAGSAASVTKTVDPETGAVTLSFGIPEGDTGDPGYSPTIQIATITGGHRITVTDSQGSASFDVMNGEQGNPGTPGDDGYSPAVTIATITGGHRVTITDEEHPTGQSFDVLDGNEYNSAPIILNSASGDIATFTDGADNRQIRKIVGTIVPVQSGTGDPSPDNVRPISGWTGANIEKRSGNLFNIDGELNYRIYYNDTNGTDLVKNGNNITVNGSNGAAHYVGQRVYVPKGTQVNASFRLVQKDSGNGGVYVAVFDGTYAAGPTSNLVSTVGDYASVTKVITSGIAAVVFFCASGTGGIITDVQVEVGNSRSSYVAYHAQNLPINWQTEAGTIYGGTVTLNEDGSADVVSDYVSVNIDRRGQFSLWDDSGRDSQGAYILASWWDYNTGYPVPTEGGGLFSYCKTATVYNNDNVWSANFLFASGSFNRFEVRLPKDVLSTIDQAGVKAYFDGHPLQAVYKIAPTTYHFDNIGELYTYLGTNNVWIDTGSITECDYPADTKTYVDDKTAPVTDVQINGTSILSDGVANIPFPNPGVAPGVVSIDGNLGINLNYGTTLKINSADVNRIKSAVSAFTPIVPAYQHAAAFYGLAKAAGDTTQAASANAVGAYTEDAKSAIHEMLNGSVAVSGTTPTIAAKSGITYVCGEVATLDITLPASGIFEVQFVSGSTPTVLTATGVTWANGFDPTALEANKTYDISISNGIGVAVWI